MLSPIYESFYGNGESCVEASCLSFLNKAESEGISRANYVLQRNKPFNPAGRYETADTAKEVDAAVLLKLQQYKEPFTFLTCDDTERVNKIMSDLGV
jgi:hypothetical protein